MNFWGSLARAALWPTLQYVFDSFEVGNNVSVSVLSIRRRS